MKSIIDSVTTPSSIDVALYTSTSEPINMKSIIDSATTLNIQTNNNMLMSIMKTIHNLIEMDLTYDQINYEELLRRIVDDNKLETIKELNQDQVDILIKYIGMSMIILTSTMDSKTV